MEFFKGDDAGAKDPASEGRAVSRTLDLPHDWSAESAFASKLGCVLSASKDASERVRGDAAGTKSACLLFGAPGRNRNCDPRLRRPMLHRPRLRAQSRPNGSQELRTRTPRELGT